MTSGLYKYIVFERDRALQAAASTISPATGSWAARTSCRTPTGSPRTTGACRSTTAPPRREAALEEAHEGPGHRGRRLHRLARRRPPDRARDHAEDLRSQRLPLSLAARGRDLHRIDHRSGQPRPGDARLRRGHPPRRGRRRRPRRRRSRAGGGDQHPRHPQRARVGRPHQGRAGSSTAAPPGSTATRASRRSTRRRRSRRRATSTPRPSWRGRPTAPATRSCSSSVHGAALRHPLRPAGQGSRRSRRVHRPRARGRIADDRRRRQQMPQLRLRRGPRRGVVAGLGPEAGTAPTTSPATRP